MIRSRMNLVLCWALVCGLVAVSAGGVSAASRSVRKTFVSVRIKVSKEVVKVGEPLDGKVILMNTSMAKHPVSFEIQLFHYDKMVSSLVTSLQDIKVGKTEISFKHFGIPAFTEAPDAKGPWRLLIVQQGQPWADAAEADIKVEPTK